MATETILTTELSAVNTMLAAIGEAPVNTITDSPSADVALAKNRLSVVSRLIQSGNWHFNSESEFPLTRDITTNKIALPANTIRVDSAPSEYAVDWIQRDGFLYDRENHTFVFTKNVKVDIAFLLPFDSLPEQARYYIAVKAARQFQASVVGSAILEQFTKQDEMEARMTFMDMEADTADHNMLNDSWAVARVLHRRT